MKTKDKIKSNKGITLIALVITIIVLLILAAVTINALSGDNGILKRAKDAKEQTNEKNQEEMGKLDDYKSTIDQYVDGTTGGGSGANFTNIDTAKSNPAGTVPAGSTVVEADANKGIVIKDKNNNEWVWIEVPKDTVFSELTIDTTGELTDQNYEDIKNKMISYAQTYREGAKKQGCNWIDEWYAIDESTLITASTSNLTDAQKALTNGCGLTYYEYKTAYEKMLKSTYTYGGFWIGRYEGGIEGSITDLTKARTDHTDIIIGTSPKAICQKNAIPYNWVTCSEAQSLANEMTPDNKYKSSLLFGIQWDLVCKYLEVKGGLSVSEINEDSSSWGNYRNIKIENITMGKYAILDTDTSKLGEWTNIKSVFTKTNSGESSNVLLGTGISEYTNRMNIYDFSGNEWEWILEKYYDSYDPCARSGGDYCHSGSYSPAANRSYYSTTKSYNSIGFRPTFYVK